MSPLVERVRGRRLLEESIVAEAVLVLQSVYKQSRGDIADALQAIVRRAQPSSANGLRCSTMPWTVTGGRARWTLLTHFWPRWRWTSISRWPPSTGNRIGLVM